MRKKHEPFSAEKLFVDDDGPTVPLMDASTGEFKPAQIFVPVLGASSFTYAEATWTQSLCPTGSVHTCAPLVFSAACLR